MFKRRNGISKGDREEMTSELGKKPERIKCLEIKNMWMEDG